MVQRVRRYSLALFEWTTLFDVSVPGHCFFHVVALCLELFLLRKLFVHPPLNQSIQFLLRRPSRKGNDRRWCCSLQTSDRDHSQNAKHHSGETNCALHPKWRKV